MQASREKGRRSTPKQPPQKKQPAGPPKARQPGPEHQKLGVFAGEWKLAGEAQESPFGPAAKVSGTQRYEWLEGGLFLIHRLEGKVGDEDIACIEVIGHDAESGAYVLNTFYNDGRRGDWTAREREGTWTFSGTFEMGEESYKIRNTAVLSEGHDTLTCKWEYAGDGAPWKTFWETTSTRA